MEHYVTEIKIEKLRHLSDIVISLNSNRRQNLIITGKNGSGKTSLLITLQKYLQAINDKSFENLMKECIPKLKIIEKEINKAETEIEKYEIKNEFYNTYF